MKTGLLGLFVLLVSGPLSAMGFSEDPGEIQKRHFDLAPFVDLTIRGEVTLEVRQGDTYSVTVQTTRALFDQFRAFSWFGVASLAVETGLLGPREAGVVQVWVTLPRLEKLTVLDRSSALVDWPGVQGTVVLKDGSTLDLSFSGSRLRLETASKTHARVTGSIRELSLLMRQGSRLDATQVQIGSADLELDEQSVAQLGDVQAWRGTLRHQARAEYAGPTAPAGTLVVN